MHKTRTTEISCCGSRGQFSRQSRDIQWPQGLGLLALKSHHQIRSHCLSSAHAGRLSLLCRGIGATLAKLYIHRSFLIDSFLNFLKNYVSYLHIFVIICHLQRHVFPDCVFTIQGPSSPDATPPSPFSSCSFLTCYMPGAVLRTGDPERGRPMPTFKEAMLWCRSSPSAAE